MSIILASVCDIAYRYPISVTTSISGIGNNMQLAEKTVSDSPARMGRPPLGKTAGDTKPIPVRLDAELRARLDASLVPGEKVAAFVRAAIVAELERRERK